MKKHLLFSLALSLCFISAIAQQKMKDGTVSYGNLPNKDAILELESANKGVLFSRVALKHSADPAPLTSHVAGMMVYNTQTVADVVPGIYYNDGKKWVLARAGQATNLTYNPTTYSISFSDPTTNNPVVVNLQEVVKKNETLTSLIKQENGTYLYTAEDDRKTIINIPADVINNFQTIANTSAVKQVLETIIKNTAGNVFFDGANFTYIDKNGINQIVNLEQVIKATETVTTLVKNGDGSYTYTNEKNDKVTLSVIGDINNNIVNQGALYATIKNVIDKEETVTSLVYDVTKNLLTFNDENKIANTIDLSQLVLKSQLTSSLSSGITTEVTPTKTLNNTDYKVEIKDGAINASKLANGAVTTDKVGGDAITSDKIKNGEVKTDKIADLAVTGAKVADKNIGAEKLVAKPADQGKVGVVQADGTVVYQNISATNVTGKDLTADDASIAVTDGTGATLINSKVKVADLGITTAKLANAAVTNDKVSTDAITSDKIKNGEVKSDDLADKNIGAEKLVAKPTDQGKVGVVQADGTVVYQNISATNVNGKDLTADDASIAVTDGTGATLVNSKVKVADLGITTAKLANAAVTNDKVSTDAITSDKIKNGEVKSDDLADKNIGAEKLVAKPADQGKVGVVQADGTVVYQNISATNVTGKDLTADDNSITVTDGTGATLINSKVKVADLGITTAKLANGAVTNDKVGADAITSDKIKNGEVKTEDLADLAVTSAKVADKNIGAEKLVAKPADQGKVGVVQADGTIVYQNISATNVTGKDLTADDNSITVTDGTGATLVNSKVKVADLGITTGKLANGAVANDKVGADAITSDKIKNGEVKTDDLADLSVTNDKVAADAITKEKIKDGSVTSTKLIATAAEQGKVGIVQADGTVVYQNISATNVTGKDLTADDNSITVTDGTGATLVNSKVKVAELGITTAKLANGAVTNDKVGADAITSDKIKNGEVKTDDLADLSVTNDKVAADAITKEKIKDGSVTSTKLIATAAEQGKVGVVQADGTVIYQNISANNVTGKDLTADDASITVTDGTGATLVNSKVKVADLGITTLKLAPGSVINDKVGADAITSDKIKNGEVKSDDLADKNIGAEKLVAKPADQGKVGVVQADGTVVYQNISATNVTGKDLTADDASIAVTDGTGATLVNSKVKVADLGITTAKLANAAVTNDKVSNDAITSDKIKNGEVKSDDLADKNIGAEKLVAKPDDQGKVGVVQADGTVVYQNISATNVTGKDLTADDNSITVTDGTGSTLVNSKVKVADLGITTAKLANGAVANDKVGADAITSDKIKNGEVKTEDLADLAVTSAKVADKNIGAEKLVAKPADQGKVGVVQADGTIVYQNISATNVTGKDLTADDNSITVTDGTGATLVNSKVKVADLGITTAKLANAAVTNDKVSTDAITSDKIKNGEVKSDDLADKNIGAEKFVAKPTDQGKVGVVQADGTVVYQNISATNVTGKDLTADDNSITVTDGTGATLINSKVKVADLGITTAKLANGAVTNDKVGADAITSDKIKNGEVKTEDLADLAVTGAKVADKNIGAEKLVAKPADQGKVGVVQADGTIVYQNISATNVTGKDLTGDDASITVTDGTGATLVNSKVKVADLGITTGKLANGAVTNDKVGADAITSDKIKNGEVKTDDLADLSVTNDKVAADAITKEKIKDGSVTSTKLIATAAEQGKVGIVQADGTVVYQNISATNVTGKDLTADDNSITVTDGTGATLVNSKVKVAELGITTAKLANGAVTNDKVGADAITSDKIKNGEVKTEDLADLAVTSAKVADKNIGAEKLVAKPVDQGKVGVVQADGTIVYQNISATNVTGKDLTADDNSITVTDGTGATLVNSKVKVADLGITTGKLANGAVANDKVGADAITSDKIKNGEVKTDDLADLSVTNDKVAADAITKEKIKNGSVTSTKLIATAAEQGKVGVVQADGTVIYQNISANNVTGKDLTADDASITVTDGTGATLVNSKVKVADLGITTLKLAPGSVINDKVGADAITSDKIKNGEVKSDDLADKNIGAEKLVAKPADQGKVGVVQADGTVVYQNISATNVTGKDLTADDASIAVTDGTGATLVNSKVKVADLGITTAKLANGAVANDKVGADAITSDKIKNGEVKTEDLADLAVTSAKVADKNIGAEKLVAKPADQGKVGVVQADGTIVYQNISATNVTGKDLTAEDNSITVTDGTGATLVNSKVKVADLGITTGKLANGAVINDKVGADAITSDKIKNGEVKTEDLADLAVTGAKVADKNIGAEKLVAKPADKGKVGVVQVDGTIVYQNISATNVTGKDLTADDNSIAVTDGTGATLVNSKVKVADLGIITAKLANAAVTNDKVGADAITSDKIKNGEVKTEDLADLGVTSDKVATDAITKEKMKDGSVTSTKLIATAAEQGKVGVVQADGTVVYQNISATNVTGKDLTADDASITVTDGTGATLVNSKVKVADLGITTTKLANNSVTNDKVGADAITSDKIKNGEVRTEDLANKTVTAVKLTAGAGSAGRIAMADANGDITYTTTIPTNSIIGENVTAASDKIKMGGTPTGAALKAFSVDVDETKLNLNANQIKGGSAGQVMVVGADLKGSWVDKSTATTVSNTSSANSLTTTVNGTSSTSVNIINSNALSLDATNKLLTSTLNGVSSGAIDISGAIIANQKTTSLSNGNNTTVTPTVTGAVTDYKVNVSSATSTTTGAVKPGAGLMVDANGTLAVDANAITTGKALTSNDLNISTSGATSLLKDVEVNIKNDAITTAKVNNKAVTAVKLDAGAGNTGRVGVADASGNITYQNLTENSLISAKGISGTGISVTGGAGSTLKDVTLSITPGTANQVLVTNNAGTATEWVSNADATIVSNNSNGNSLITSVNGKAATAVNIVNSNALTLDASNKLVSTVNGVASSPALEISSAVVASQKTSTLSNGTNTTVAAITTGNVTDYKVNVATASATTLGLVKQAVTNAAVTVSTTGELGINANNGLAVANNNLQLGGALTKATVITTGGSVTPGNTLAIAGLQTGSGADKIVVADATTGILKQVNAATPKWFYMPSIVLDVANISNGKTVDLYALYVAQFNNIPGTMNSTGVTKSIPFLPNATDLEYYVTYVDSTVINVTQVSSTGVMTYNVIGKAKTTSFANIVFVVK